MLNILYPTHKRSGLLHGETLGIVFLISGMYSVLNLKTPNDQLVGVLLCLSGGIIGCELPDCDSPSSKPSQHYPWLHLIFELFHVEHRGKFSHSWLSQTLVCLFLFIFSCLGLQTMTTQNANLTIKIIIWLALENILNVTFLYFYQLFKSDTFKNGEIFGYLMYLMTDDKEYKKRINFKQPNAPTKLSIRIFAFVVSAVFALLIPVAGTHLLTLLGLFIFGLWWGIISHLIMDTLTLNGTWLDWSHQIRPIAVARHIPILKPIIGKGTTNSPYETKIRVVVSILDLVCFFVLIISFIQH